VEKRERKNGEVILFFLPRTHTGVNLGTNNLIYFSEDPGPAEILDDFSL
jgi:hypothetical protein